MEFVVRYLLAVLSVVFYTNFYQLLLPITFFLASLISSVFFSLTVGDYSFILGSHVLQFVDACVATSAYVLWFILLFATRGIVWKKRFMLLFVGWGIILAVNIVRIEVLLWVLAQYGFNAFERIHLFIWEFVSSVFVALLWIIFVKSFRIHAIPFVDDVHYLLRSIQEKK